MCQIVCQICQEPIENDDQVIESRHGFVEKGDFTPEEIFHEHLQCHMTENPPNDK